MFSNKLILATGILLVTFTSDLKKQNQYKIYFIDNDSIIELNGHVKHVEVETVDDSNSPDPRQDYGIVDINKQGDVTKILIESRSGAYQTYYITTRNNYGKRLETKGYTRTSDISLDPMITADTLDTLIKKRLAILKLDTIKKLFSVFSYNNQNEIISYILSPNKPLDSISYKYNSEGRLIETDNYLFSKHPADKFLTSVMKYKYDKNNLIEADQFNNLDHLIFSSHFKYLNFDLENNWIKMVMYSDALLGKRTITTRKITYY